MKDQNSNNIDAGLPANSFIGAIASMDYGNLVPECSEKLSKLVKEVVATGRKGKFQLTIVVAPGKGEGRIMVESESNLTLPKPQKGQSMFFGTEHGQLLRNDPRQKEMNFEDGPRVVRPAANDG